MNIATPLSNAPSFEELARRHAMSGALSWSAILAGAAAAVALSLILLILGTDLGFFAVSAWSQKGISAGSFGVPLPIIILITLFVH